MKTFKNIKEARNSLVRKKKVDEKLVISNDEYSQIMNSCNLKPGKFFLYEELISDSMNSFKITYPKIGIFLKNTLVDQAEYLEWIDVERTKEWNTKYMLESGYPTYLGNDSVHIKSIILWSHDDLFIYGSWDKLPNWKELKKYYRKTLWFNKTKSEKRNLILKSLLK